MVTDDYQHRSHVGRDTKLYHFVVIYKVASQKITFMNLADSAMHCVSAEDFKSQWTGVLILLLLNKNKEETSSLDLASEQYIKNARKTIIIVDSDKIMEISSRTLIEDSDHHLLFVKDTLYYNLWQKQLRQI